MNQTQSQSLQRLWQLGLCGLGLIALWSFWPGCQRQQVKREPITQEPTTRREPPRRETNAKEPQRDTTRDAKAPDQRQATERRTPEPKRDNPTTEKTTSAGVWSKLTPIDIHAHIGSFSGYDLSTPTLMANVNKYGIRWALISNIDGANLSSTKNISEDLANEATIKAVRKYPNQLRGIYWTRPNKGISKRAEVVLQSTLSTTNKQRIFVAMKFHPDMNQFPADSSKLDPYMKLCDKYKMAAVFHSGSAGSNSDPQKIYVLAKRFPNVPVVLYHMGFFGPHNGAIKAAETAKKQGDAKLYLGTAQADPKAVLQAVKMVGSSYVMFGTDAAYFAPDHYGRYKALVQALQSGLSTTDLNKVMHDNAKQLFQLPR